MSQFPADRRETWITGIGLVTSLGDGLEANWDALRSGRVNIDLERYAPWIIHPLVPLNLDSQIPRKGDQRQMEPWQRIGCACRKLNPAILVMQSAQGWATKNVPGAIDGARDRRIFLQR